MKRVPTAANELNEQTDSATFEDKSTHGKIRLREFSRSLPMALLRTREAAMRHFRPRLRQFDISEQQWRVLRALASVVEIDATALANVTFLRAPSLTRILKDLEMRELILRRVDPKDQRAALISLSSSGRSLLDEAGVHSERIYRAMTARIGEARLDTLMALLKAVENSLDEPIDLTEN
jgi:homoprotocatechuate degradation regulator HpaR